MKNTLRFCYCIFRQICRKLKLSLILFPQSRCACLNQNHTSDNSVMDDLMIIREKCLVLRELLIPDCSVFRTYDVSLVENDTVHRSMLLLAYERGHLKKITLPIHRFLEQRGNLKKTLTEQYRQDLKENWLSNKDALDRQKRFKSYFGKIVELQCAEWLYEHGWEICNLEALGGNIDILAINKISKRVAFEIKYIGLEDWDFVDIVESINGVGKGRAVSPQTAANFLLFKAYTAGKQLNLIPHSRICIIVINTQTWHRFGFVLRNEWIDWGTPKLFKADSGWGKFLESQKSKYPNMDKDFQEIIKSMDEIWIMKLSEGFQYSKEYSFNNY
jgi:Holliday junction resolvase-like predicted endonuclease